MLLRVPLCAQFSVCGSDGTGHKKFSILINNGRNTFLMRKILMNTNYLQGSSSSRNDMCITTLTRAFGNEEQLIKFIHYLKLLTWFLKRVYSYSFVDYMCNDICYSDLSVFMEMFEITEGRISNHKIRLY